MTDEKLPEEFVNNIAEVVKMVGHVQRMRILEYLDIHGESTVTAIVDGVGGQQGAVSQHLNRMRQAGVIAARRNGRQVLYHLTSENVITILNCFRRRCQARLNGEEPPTHE